MCALEGNVWKRVETQDEWGGRGAVNVAVPMARVGMDWGRGRRLWYNVELWFRQWVPSVTPSPQQSDENREMDVHYYTSGIYHVCRDTCVYVCTYQDKTITQCDISLFPCYAILYTQIFSIASSSETVLRYGKLEFRQPNIYLLVYLFIYS
jgi:hypothetical protein